MTYSRPTTGTGMPLQERFGARPMWACLVACPVNEITSFVVDSSRSRKSVNCFFRLHKFFADNDDLTPVAPRQQGRNCGVWSIQRSRPVRKARRPRNFPRFRRHCVLVRFRRRANQKASPYRQKEPGADCLPSAVLTFIKKGVPDCAGFASGPLWKGGRGKGSTIRFDPIKSRVSPLS